MYLIYEKPEIQKSVSRSRRVILPKTRIMNQKKPILNKERQRRGTHRIIKGRAEINRKKRGEKETNIVVYLTGREGNEGNGNC